MADDAAAQGIRIEGLRKRYGQGDTAVDALKGVDMQVAPGEVVGLIGPSGSGKSTLLKCLGAVIEPTAGRMTLGDEVIYDDGWKIRDLRALRRDRIGFVFQAPYLIPFLDVTDNVALLPMLAGQPNAEAREQARDLLEALDVAHRATAMPSQLSGGEQQRVAIARALVNRPPVILADEPTAPLDSERALAVIRILNQMARQYRDRDHRRHARREDHPDLQAQSRHRRRGGEFRRRHECRHRDGRTRLPGRSRESRRAADQPGLPGAQGRTPTPTTSSAAPWPSATSTATASTTWWSACPAEMIGLDSAAGAIHLLFGALFAADFEDGAGTSEWSTVSP